MKPRLWHFNGGLKLDGHKAMSMHQAVTKAAIPPRLVLPLQQHIGTPAEPVVNVGDTVLKNQVIAQASDYVSVPIHAPTSGNVVAIEEHPVPHPSGMNASCIIIETDGKDTSIETDSTSHNYHKLEPSALRNLIREAGIVGLGGAGFPSFIKLNPGLDGKIKTLILNGAECEPYITCDAMLMQDSPRKIIDGLLIMRHALKVDKCIIAIEDNKRAAHTMLVNALREDEAEIIKIILVPTIYPAGGEKQIIKVVTGKEVPSHGLPIDVGVVCHNVGTAAAIADAILSNQPLIERYVTVTGNAVKQPRNLKVLIGTPIEALLKECEGSNVQQCIMGGPMMGFELNSNTIPVIKTTNCILTSNKKYQAPTSMPCIRCGECAKVCPAQLLPQQLYWYSRAQDFDKVQDYNLFDCIECGCCAYVCPSHIPLVQYYRFAKTEIWAQERDKQKSDAARERHEFRLYRMERKKQEDEERKRRKKELLKATAGEKTSEEDKKKAAIEAAMARVKAKREKQHAAQANIDHLTEAQKKAIAEIEARRAKAREKQQAQIEESKKESGSS
jgi:electron transport complex protein RnfC